LRFVKMMPFIGEGTSDVRVDGNVVIRYFAIVTFARAGGAAHVTVAWFWLTAETVSPIGAYGLNSDPSVMAIGGVRTDGVPPPEFVSGCT
jgi:hypothetical protein